MAILDKISRLFWVDVEEKADTLSDTEQRSSLRISDYIDALVGPKAKSGVVVNARNTISLSAVWRAINLIAESIASMPFEVTKETLSGSTRVDKNHPVHNLINSEPNELYTSFDFRHTLMIHVLLYGNAYAYIKRNDGNANVKRLTILDPTQVDVFYHENTLLYKYALNGETYGYDEIIHIKNTSLNGFAGLNSLDVHTENFGLGLASRDFGSNLYKNGAFPSGVMEGDKPLSDSAYNRLKGSFAAAYAGLQNVGKVPILEEGFKFKPISMSPKDALLIESQKFSIEDVSRIFGVPMHLLSALDRATFNNIEQLSLEFAKYTIRPWAKRIEQEFNRKIFKESEKNRTKTRFNMDAFLRGDTESRAKFYKEAIGNGWMSINEVRSREKLNAVDGGNIHFIPLNMAILKDGKINVPVQDNNPNKNTNTARDGTEEEE